MLLQYTLKKLKGSSKVIIYFLHTITKKKIKNKMKISELPGDEEGLTCKTYVFQNESHTLGNALKCIIDRYDDVQFCGYTVPHPAEAKMHFRIQTYETPTLDVLKRGLTDLQKVCDHTIDLFDKEIKEYTKT